MYNIAKIFDLLKERNLEQKDLAKGIGVSTSNVTEWKKGRATPSSKVVPKIADYFKLPLSDFYVFDESEEIKKDHSANAEQSKVSLDESIMKKFEKLTDEEQEKALSYIDYLLKQQEETKNK